jgi:hypothetical protein
MNGKDALGVRLLKLFDKGISSRHNNALSNCRFLSSFIDPK